MKQKGSLEILLLLCCLVGAVAFICFAVCVGNMAEDESGEGDNPRATPAAVATVTQLEHDLQLRQKLIERLAQQIKELQQEIEQTERLLAQRSQQREEAAAEAAAKEAEFERLKDEAARLESQIQEKQRLLQSLRQAAATKTGQDAAARQQVEAQLAELLAALEEVEKQLRTAAEELEALKRPVQDSGEMDQTIAALQAQIEEERKKLAVVQTTLDDLKKSANRYNPFDHLTGAKLLKKPMFVECKKQSLLFHSSGENVSFTEQTKENPFASRVSGYDGIILLVRPDGFESFGIALSWAEKTGLKLQYEPVDAAKDLVFKRQGDPS